MKVETLCEEDIKPTYLENKDHMSPTRSSFNERAEACEEYLKDLMKLDSETDKDLEKILVKDPTIKGN